MQIDKDAAERLADSMRGYRSGEVTVLDVKTDVRYTPDRDFYLQVDLRVTAPPRGELTWELDDVREIEDEALARALEIGLSRDDVATFIIDTGQPPADDQTAAGGAA